MSYVEKTDTGRLDLICCVPLVTSRYLEIIKFVHNGNVFPKQNETVAVYTGQDCTIYGREVEFSCYVVGVGK